MSKTRSESATKTKHTSGEWTADLEKSQGEGAFKRVHLVAGMQGGIGELFTDYEGWEANAKLIIAAADMLEALKDLKTVINDILLPKCRGESEDLWAVQSLQAEAAFSKAEKAMTKAEGSK